MSCRHVRAFCGMLGAAPVGRFAGICSKGPVRNEGRRLLRSPARRSRRHGALHGQQRAPHLPGGPRPAGALRRQSPWARFQSPLGRVRHQRRLRRPRAGHPNWLQRADSLCRRAGRTRQLHVHGLDSPHDARERGGASHRHAWPRDSGEFRLWPLRGNRRRSSGGGGRWRGRQDNRRRRDAAARASVDVRGHNL